MKNCSTPCWVSLYVEGDDDGNYYIVGYKSLSMDDVNYPHLKEGACSPAGLQFFPTRRTVRHGFRPCYRVQWAFTAVAWRHSWGENWITRDRVPIILHCECLWQRKVIFYKATNAAGFAGWIPLIDFGKSFSLRCEFVLKHRAEHTKTIIS